MTGDFSRDTYRAKNHYRSVRMQQGRVQLDSDWNEREDIGTHRMDTEAADVVGQSGGPYSGAGFALAPSETDSDDFTISAGHYYVDGRLCENDDQVSYRHQPDLQPSQRTKAGVYLAYLDVWERQLTALDDPNLREVALGGPDTATRMKLVWQVKLLAVDDAELAAGVIKEWQALSSRSPGKLSARLQPPNKSREPCLIEPGAGYRGLENQLYRVEIHPRTKASDPVTFKWSRNNGATLASWTGPEGPSKQLQVSSLGRDSALGFERDDWVEVFDDTCVLEGLPGTLVRLSKVEGQTLTLAEGMPPVDRGLFPNNPQVRGWNTQNVTGTLLVEGSSDSGGWVELEAGVAVKFDGGSYPGGNYWSIPARTAQGKLGAPFSTEDAQPPLGIAHHYAQLALLDYDGKAFSVRSDLRSFFPAITELKSLSLLGGNGQMAAVGQELPALLQAGVASGRWPVQGATVRFTVTGGAGTLKEASAANDPTSLLDVVTGEEGIASCRWTLGPGAPQQVTATLLDGAGDAQHLPVCFNATVGVTEVDPVIRITGVTLQDGTPLGNDTEVSPSSLVKGIKILCDTEIAPESISRATCSVTLELPFPISGTDTDFWGAGIVGHVPVVLRGTPSVQVPTSLPNPPQSPAVLWTPQSETGEWLQERLFGCVDVKKHPHEDRLLVWLTLQGNFIWAANDPSKLLDGDSFGAPGATNQLPQTALQPIIGDGRRGGTFKTWFWLVQPTVTITPDSFSASPGESVKLTVQVQGPSNTAATLTLESEVDGLRGTLKADVGEGAWIYTAPTLVHIPHDVTIVATSDFDPNCKGTSIATLERSIIIGPGGPPDLP